MPPGSKKSSASSNSTGTMRNIAAVRVETIATTPASEMLTSTPLTVASPSTRASAAGKCTGVAKRRRVRGPTRGKRIRRIIVENKGERISAYVTPEMRAFCGMNANKVADRSGGIGNEGNDDDGNGNEPNSNEGNGNEGKKKFDFCDLYEASHRLRDTNEWIDPKCQEKHVMMVEMHDAAALSGTPLSTEEISIKYLGESKTKNYIRGFGNGPMPSTYLSKSNSQSTLQDQLQKLQHELDLFREEQRREREEEKTRREEEQKQREEEQRRHEEEQRRHEEEREEEKRRWEETQRRQDEEQSILLKEMDVFKSFMSQFKNGGRGNMGAG